MRVALWRGCLGFISVWSCIAMKAQPTAPSLTPGDLSAASYIFSNDIDAELQIRNTTLHQARLLPDGSHGYVYRPMFEAGATPYTGDSAKDAVVRLHQEACQAPDIVVAEAGPAAGYLIHGDQAIVTARSFLVKQVIAGNLQAGQTVTTVFFGGVVHSGSETLSVEVYASRPPLQGKTYLLFLLKYPNYPSSAYFDLDDSPDLVMGNKLYRSPHAGDDIMDSPHGTGESLTKFKSNLDKALALHKCN